VWRGRNDEEVDVEIFALQHYERLGYKGFDIFSPYDDRQHSYPINSRYHSEGSIVRTIFGLLFFDIIFASIPGAFETPYQSAPLDIAEDAFYYARKDLIESRLLEIEAGAARRIIERVDAQHRDKRTWCVGVHWDLFEKQDLVEIVQVCVWIRITVTMS
jgi:fanconi-associated nuclease 1